MTVLPDPCLEILCVGIVTNIATGTIPERKGFRIII
jgi:hypothetical protein